MSKCAHQEAYNCFFFPRELGWGWEMGRGEYAEPPSERSRLHVGRQELFALLSVVHNLQWWKRDTDFMETDNPDKCAANSA